MSILVIVLILLLAAALAFGFIKGNWVFFYAMVFIILLLALTQASGVKLG